MAKKPQAKDAIEMVMLKYSALLFLNYTLIFSLFACNNNGLDQTTGLSAHHSPHNVNNNSVKDLATGRIYNLASKSYGRYICLVDSKEQKLGCYGDLPTGALPSIDEKIALVETNSGLTCAITEQGFLRCFADEKSGSYQWINNINQSTEKFFTHPGSLAITSNFGPCAVNLQKQLYCVDPNKMLPDLSTLGPVFKVFSTTAMVITIAEDGTAKHFAMGLPIVSLVGTFIDFVHDDSGVGSSTDLLGLRTDNKLELFPSNLSAPLAIPVNYPLLISIIGINSRMVCGIRKDNNQLWCNDPIINLPSHEFKVIKSDNFGLACGITTQDKISCFHEKGVSLPTFPDSFKQ